MAGRVIRCWCHRQRASIAPDGKWIVGGFVLALAALWVHFLLQVDVYHESLGYATSVLQPMMVFYSPVVIMLLCWLACRWASRTDRQEHPKGYRCWRILSDASFGIYLVHVFILTAMLQWVVPLMPSDQQGFIAVYPQGVVGPDGRTGWATGASNSPQVNDVLFVSDLLDHLHAILCIDPRRIYATGFSNGGGMTNVLACTLAGRLAAFAPVSGAYPPYPSGCHPVRPVPLLEFHGTADPTVPYNGSARKRYPLILTWLQGWATRDGCTSGPTVFYKQANVTGLEWTNCQGNAIVIQYRISGEGHVWPHVTFNKPGGTAVYALSASALIWSFFQQHPLPGTFR